MKNNISIIWDFDGTLTPQDSTTEVIKSFVKDTDKFWDMVKEISGTKSKKPVSSISTSDAPVWMYILSELAKDDQGRLIALNKEGMKKLIAHKIKFYPEVCNFLEKIKNLSSEDVCKKNNISIYHFIITAGLEGLVRSVFEYNNSHKLITAFFGCRYRYSQLKSNNGKIEYKNIPMYCMDKTTKTRALFEICKGCFLPNSKYEVDDLVPKEKEWCPFENMIYIGDGETDIPAFSLVKSRRGLSIGVFDKDAFEEGIEKKAKNIKKGKRIDLFVPADFSLKGELFKFIKSRCYQIAKRYEAHTNKVLKN